MIKIKFKTKEQLIKEGWKDNYDTLYKPGKVMIVDLMFKHLGKTIRLNKLIISGANNLCYEDFYWDRSAFEIGKLDKYLYDQRN